ncbi:hypothetical protein FRB93_005933 [Tulasnella sp. JGI-2019a]|nr:hypothetical protein FRB93_005933 [Tulasnella sp. JGI-2019a]
MSSFKDVQPGPFGSLGDLWTKYDKLADKFDKDMLASLNTNLDVLLIFAGLFSAVNTAFIVVVLAALSANPLDQTNHLLQLLVMGASNTTLTPNDLTLLFVPGEGAVRQNCTFFASLCCSLLAAAGAMLAKQWLQEYARTGQTGTVEEQARGRADKFRGAQRWGLRFVVEALPALLLISLALFFVGLVDYLWTVDRTVALVVLAFAAVGATFYGFTVVVGVVYTASPFQTAVSVVTRRVQRPFRDVLYSQHFLRKRTAPYSIWDPIIASVQLGAERVGVSVSDMRFDLKSPIDTKELLFDSLKALRWFLWTIISPIALLFPCLLIWPIRVSDIDELDASSAIWIAETAPDRDHLLIVAENIPLITNINAMQLIAHSSVFSLLLSKFTESFLEAQRNHTEDNKMHAIAMARAVASVLLADPERSCSAVMEACLAGFNHTDRDRRWVRDWAQDCRHLFRAIFGICDDRYGGYNELLPSLGNSPFQGIQTTSDATLYLRYCIIFGLRDFVFRGGGKWLDDNLSSALLLDGRKVDETYLSCASRTLLILLHRHSGQSQAVSPRDMVKLAWMDNSVLGQDISAVLGAFAHYYKLVGSPLPTSPEPPEMLARMLRFQQHFLTQIQSLYPTFEIFPLLDNTRPRYPLYRIQSQLSKNIRSLVALEGAELLPEGDGALTCCRKEITAVLERLLVSGEFPYSSPEQEVDAIAATARSVHAECSDIEDILRGLLYRYFLLAVHYLPPEQQREPRIVHLRNRSIAPVLTSALRLCIWLYPRNIGMNTVRGESWRLFSSVFMYMIGNEVRNTLPRPLSTLNHNEMWRALVTTVREGDLGTYESIGPSLMWLAETIHLIPAEHWADGCEEDRFVQLFTRVMRGHGVEETGAVSPTGVWNRDDGMAGGVLFIRAWERVTTALRGQPTHEPSTAWTSTPAIEAFKVWLDGYHGHTIVEIKNIVLVSATISHDVVFRFAHHALKVNPEAAVGSGLHEAVGRLIQRLEARDAASAESREEVERWKGDIGEALLRARRWLERPHEDVTAPRRWTRNGLSRVCGAARLDVLG